jgi:hypothetical protein
MVLSSVSIPLLQRVYPPILNPLQPQKLTTEGCQQFQENIHITQQGHNRGNFPGGGRRSFEIIETDGDCSLILFEGSGNTGTKLNLGNQKNIHVCEGAADGRYFLSFDVYCA